ncbi:MAG: hypothetical protein QOI61_1946 [Actinomycetota bacterium]|jgi:hypothetical protein
MRARVLGIDVDAALLTAWRDWLAPEIQPFFVESLRRWPKLHDRHELQPELHYTYTLWNVPRRLKTLWLDEATFFELPRAARAALVRDQVTCGRGAVPTVRKWADLSDATELRSQADGHRFVWWPSLIAHSYREVCARFVESDGLPPYPRTAAPSRHREVPNSTWRACAAVVPGARSLAGTFPFPAGANCFGTVMAASGIASATNEWMLREPFLAWLRSACRPGGRDEDPGTVLVWRDHAGLPVHAAVTMGDGWAFEKASGAWWTPRVVAPVDELIRTNRSVGLRLERHHIARQLPRENA